MRRSERCVCHNQKVKPHKGKQARCPVKGHYCSTYMHPYSGVSRKSFTEQVNTITERHMMPKIADSLLSESPLLSAHLEQQFVNDVHRFSKLDATTPWYQRLNPWSEFNTLALRIARASHKYARQVEEKLNQPIKIKRMTHLGSTMRHRRNGRSRNV